MYEVQVIDIIHDIFIWKIFLDTLTDNLINYTS